jgi:hypothetical protein
MRSVVELNRGKRTQLAFSSIPECVDESRKTFFSSLLKPTMARIAAGRDIGQSCRWQGNFAGASPAFGKHVAHQKRYRRMNEL